VLFAAIVSEATYCAYGSTFVQEPLAIVIRLVRKAAGSYILFECASRYKNKRMEADSIRLFLMNKC